MDLGGDDERADEMEVLQAIFPPDELTIIAAAPYYFRITLTCSGDATEDGELFLNRPPPQPPSPTPLYFELQNYCLHADFLSPV